MSRFIPFRSYAPDAPLYPQGGESAFGASLVNALPVSKYEVNGAAQIIYGPVAAPVQYASPLAARCQGAHALLDTSGAGHVFAADATKIYRLTVASTTFEDVSRAAGYSVAADDFVSFASYGNQVLATNFTDPIQTYTLGSSTDFADLAASAPKAKYIAVVNNFVVAAHTLDGASGTRPQRVWWSAIGDPASWPSPGTPTAAQIQSDYQDIVGDHGAITGIVPAIGNTDAVIFFERAIYSMRYVGPPAIFAIEPIVGAKGSYAPRSIVRAGAAVAYYASEGFHLFDGSVSRPIGLNRVDATFTKELNESHIGRMVGAADARARTVIWSYPGSGSTGATTKALAYNWAIDEWAPLDIAAEYLFPAVTFGLSLEGLGAIYPSLDAVPFPLDSAVWSGEAGFILAGFDATHRLTYFQGEPLAPRVTTGEFMAGDGRRSPLDLRGLVVDSRPVYQGASFTPMVAIGASSVLGSHVYGTPVAMTANGNCPQRASGRYFTARLSGSGRFEKLIGVEVTVRPNGLR